MEEKPKPQCVIPLHNPDTKEKIFFFVSGLLVSVPFALYLGQVYDFLPIVLSTVLLAPFIEELAKVFPLFYRHGETERSIVNLGVLTGLGFGITEFFLYVFLIGVDPLARLPGVVFHASSAAITAYGIAKKRPLPFFLIAVALHMVNNFAAVALDYYVALLVQIIVLVLVYYVAWYFYRRASKEKMVT